MSIVAVFDALVGVAHSALEHLAEALTPFAGGLSGALAIVLFTLLVRLLISPLTYLQVRGERRRAALAPEIENLRARHRDDPLTLATETVALQRAAGAGPFVTLLPGLAQAPFFMIMLRLVHPGAVVTGLLAGAAFGVPLTAHLFAGLPVFAVLLALAGVLAWWSSRRMRRTLTPAPTALSGSAPSGSAPSGSAPSGSAPSGSAAPSGSTRPTRRTKSAGSARSAGPTGPTRPTRPTKSAGSARSAGPAAPAGLGRILPLLPYGTVLVVAYLPLAGALYLVTSTAWTALEHAIWRRPVITGNR